MQKQHALDQVERVDDEQIVLAVAAAHDQPVESREQALRNVPLEALLQLEEFSEGRVAREVGQHFALRLVSVSSGGCSALFPGAARAGQADLGEQPLDLFQAFSNFATVKRRQIVEGERQ